MKHTNAQEGSNLLRSPITLLFPFENVHFTYAEVESPDSDPPRADSFSII